jgi:hypothetical protein
MYVRESKMVVGGRGNGGGVKWKRKIEEGEQKELLIAIYEEDGIRMGGRVGTGDGKGVVKAGE